MVPMPHMSLRASVCWKTNSLKKQAAASRLPLHHTNASSRSSLNIKSVPIHEKYPRAPYDYVRHEHKTRQQTPFFAASEPFWTTHHSGSRKADPRAEQSELIQHDLVELRTFRYTSNQHTCIGVVLVPTLSKIAPHCQISEITGWYVDQSSRNFNARLFYFETIRKNTTW